MVADAEGTHDLDAGNAHNTPVSKTINGLAWAPNGDPRPVLERQHVARVLVVQEVKRAPHESAPKKTGPEPNHLDSWRVLIQPGSPPSATVSALARSRCQSRSPERVGHRIKNAETSTLTSITIALTGKQWRRGDVASPETLAFEYGLADDISSTTLDGENDLDFTAPVTGATGTNAAVDGNAHNTPVSKTINDLSWAPNATLVLRWSASTQSGKDDGLAIDDFSFSAH